MTKEELVERIFVSRKERASHPEGRTDNGGRWHASSLEFCICCASIRGPSRAHPWSHMIHCRTKKHIKELVARHYEKNLAWLEAQA